MTSLLFTAFSGAVAALVLRSLLKIAGKYWISRKPIAEYDCATDVADPQALGLWHGYGKRVADNGATSGFAWEHTPERKEGVHTIYGPYVNDMGRPGYVRVRFRVSGAGFDRVNEGAIILDVNQIVHEAPSRHITIGQAVVRSKDLKLPYRWFDVICYTSGVGLYEYRARVLHRVFDEKRHRIHFDIIRVYRHFPVWEFM